MEPDSAKKLHEHLEGPLIQLASEMRVFRALFATPQGGHVFTHCTPAVFQVIHDALVRSLLVKIRALLDEHRPKREDQRWSLDYALGQLRPRLSETDYSVLRDQLDSISRLADAIRSHVDQRIAHLDGSRVLRGNSSANRVTFDELVSVTEAILAFVKDLYLRTFETEYAYELVIFDGGDPEDLTRVCAIGIGARDLCYMAQAEQYHRERGLNFADELRKLHNHPFDYLSPLKQRQ